MFIVVMLLATPSSIEAFCLRMLRGALLMRKTAGMRWAEKQCNGDLREKSVVG